MSGSVEVSTLMQRYSYNPDDGLLKRISGPMSGTIVTSKDKRGYIRLTLFGKYLFAHRVAWALHFGSFPDGLIDHVNGMPDDNRIANLRIASRSQNMMNSRFIKGSSKFKGVRRSQDAWQAEIMIGGKRHYLGRFKSEIDAARAYDAAAAKLFGEFALPNSGLHPR